MRNLILFACFFNFFINPVFAEFQTSEILEKIKNGRAAIYSSLDLTSEQTHEINELDRIFYEKLYPELQEMSMLSQKLERIASSSDCTIKKVKSVRKEFKVVEVYGAKMMPIFHPSYLLRNDTREKGGPKWLMWQDIQEIKCEYDKL